MTEADTDSHIAAAIAAALEAAGVAVAIGPDAAALIVVDPAQAASWFRNAMTEHYAEQARDG